jgi:hypothetical protein
MKRTIKSKAGGPDRAFLARRREFVDSIAEVFHDKLYDRWIPVFAKTFYRFTKKSTEEIKIKAMKQTLAAFSSWTEELRILLVRDLGRFVRMEQSHFLGDAKNWMEMCCKEIWGQGISEESYLEWFAAACDDSDNLEKWRAPLWLAKAFGMAREDVRLEEPPEQSGEEEFDECERLDLENTNGLIRSVFESNELNRLLRVIPVKVDQEIISVHLSISQGANLAPGLHGNDEEPIAQAISRLLTRFPYISQRAKRHPRKKTLTERQHEAVIRAAIKRGYKGRQYCREVDDTGGRISDRWLSRGCPPTYEAAYLKGDPWRRSILTEKSKIKVSMGKSQKSQKA